MANLKKSYSTIKDRLDNFAQNVRTFITRVDTEEIRQQVVNLLNSTLITGETTFTGATTTSGSGIYAYDTTGSTVTLTIASSDISDGATIVVKDKGGAASTDNITVATEGSEDIDGSSTQTISSNYGSLIIYCDGSNAYTF